MRALLDLGFKNRQRIFCVSIIIIPELIPYLYLIIKT